MRSFCLSKDAIKRRSEPQTRRRPAGLAPGMNDSSTGRWIKDGNKQHTSDEVLSSEWLHVKMIR